MRHLRRNREESSISQEVRRVVREIRDQIANEVGDSVLSLLGEPPSEEGIAYRKWEERYNSLYSEINGKVLHTLYRGDWR